MPNQDRQPKTGWSSTISTLSLAALAFLTTTGLLIAYVPFHATMEWGVLIHTLIGLVVLLPIVWYSWIHWADYRQYNLSDALLLGYVAVLALALCLVSGVVVTWQGLFGLRMSPSWRTVHLYSTWVTLVTRPAPYLVGVDSHPSAGAKAHSGTRCLAQRSHHAGGTRDHRPTRRCLSG